MFSEDVSDGANYFGRQSRW